MNKYCVITTINKPTKAVEKLYEHFGSNLIIVGDRKTPSDWNYKGIKPDWAKCEYAPDNHYAKKNVGYILAISRGAHLIYDTDDDNIPNENWKIRTKEVYANSSICSGWYNVYSVLSGETIWPRGFSIRYPDLKSRIWDKKDYISSIQQGLSDGEPDVDAIWRLVFHKKHYFKIKRSIYIEPNAWCPFNSQSTWWFPKAFPLMYLPVYASFRMTDIWRSFVAQRCLWELGEGVTFHSPSEVFQERNEHDLMKDFEQEVPGYLNNDRIVEILGELELQQGEEAVCGNLLTCYLALVNRKILPMEEIKSVMAWIEDYENITRPVQQAQERRLA